MIRAWLVTVLLAPALTGCLTSPSAQEAPDNDTPEVSFPMGADGAVDASADLADCVEVATGLQVEVEHAQRYLPEGFTAAEGRPFGGNGPRLPTGTVTVVVAALSCGSSELEQGALDHFVITMDVEPPRTDAVEARTTHDVYRLQTYSEGDRHVALLKAADASVAAAEVAVDVQANPAASSGFARIVDAEGVVFELESAGGGRVPGGVSARFWEVLPSGLLVLDWEQDEEPLVAYDLGPVSSCRVRAGTLLHGILGTTDCTDMPATGMVIPNWRTEGRLRVVPDDSVEAVS